MICGTDFFPTRKDNRASYAEQERDLASSSEECDSKAIYIAALAMTNRTGILMMRYRGAFSSLALAPSIGLGTKTPDQCRKCREGN